MPDGTSRFSVTKDGMTTEILHFMGTSTFSEYTVAAEISLAKVSKSAVIRSAFFFGQVQSVLFSHSPWRKFAC